MLRKEIFMEKALVTGGFGFIGFHLVERLLSEGIEVIAIDEMPAHKKNVQEEMKMRVGRNALLTIIEEKVENCPLQKWMKEVDVVFHLAASPSEECEWQTLDKVIENNVNVTTKLVNSLHKNIRLVYPSTIEVYGEREGVVTENTPTNPITPYGITKLASENVIKKNCLKKGNPFVILRLPTVYGPWNHHSVPDEPADDVLYVDDVIDALMLAATTKAVNEVYHLTSKNEEETNEKERPMILSSEKSKRLLQFTAKTSLQEGLKKLKEHIKKSDFFLN